MSSHLGKRKASRSLRSNRPRKTRKKGESDLQESSGFIKVYRNDLRRTMVTIPKGCQFFPDEYRCWANTDFTVTLTGSTGSPYTMKLNSPFNLFGPQLNFSGAFAANVASGSNAIIATNAAAGVTPPYNVSTVLACNYEITLLTAAGAVANTTPFFAGAFPSIGASFGGMSISQFKEQPFCVYAAVPSVATEPVMLKGSIDFSTIFGVPKSTIANINGTYGQIVGSDPLSVLYHQLYLAALDGTTNVSLTIQFRYNLLYLFRKRNNLNTTVPT